MSGTRFRGEAHTARYEKRSTVRRVILGALLMLIPAIGISDAQRLHDIPIPPEATMQAISLNVIQHGHRLSMATLQSTSAIESTLVFYRDLWASSDESVPGFMEDKVDDWHIISQVEDGWNKVVQIRSTPQGTEAYVSVLEIEPLDNWSYEPAMPSGAVLVSSMSGDEFGKPTQTDIVFSKARSGEVAGFYRSHFKAHDWRIVSDKDVETSTVLLLQNRDGQAEVVVTQARNGSVAVINRVGGNE